LASPIVGQNFHESMDANVVFDDLS